MQEQIWTWKYILWVKVKKFILTGTYFFTITFIHRDDKFLFQNLQSYWLYEGTISYFFFSRGKRYFLAFHDTIM